MHAKRLFVLVTIACFIGVGSPRASAQIRSGLNEASSRIIFESGRTNVDASRTTFLDLNGYYGRFITDRVEIGPNASIVWTEGSDAFGTVGGFVDYHFGRLTSRMVPFVDFTVGRAFGQGPDNPTMFGAMGGVKWFVGEGGGAVNLGPYWRQFRYENSHENVFGIGIGLAKYW